MKPQRSLILMIKITSVHNNERQYQHFLFSNDKLRLLFLCAPLYVYYSQFYYCCYTKPSRFEGLARTIDKDRNEEEKYTKCRGRRAAEGGPRLLRAAPRLRDTPTGK